ncbi:MAG: methylmalonyl-CoA mutase family protein [Steroidobacteraceae bacterium]
MRRASASSRPGPRRQRSADRRGLQLQGARPRGQGENYTETLSRNRIPKIAAPLPRLGRDPLVRAQREPAGRLPVHRGRVSVPPRGGDPIRMFAGENPPERTNHRFHYLARGQRAVRLSATFDSTTLYGEDPDTRPDIYGRTGNGSGVSIATLDDMKKLYSGFDLCAPSTSVSMTINGPAPMILAMYMNTAVDQRVERWLREQGRWAAAERRIAQLHAAIRARGLEVPGYKGRAARGPRWFGPRAARRHRGRASSAAMPAARRC